MKTSEEIKDLCKALASMQAEMTNASKDCKGYNYKYADLASVWGVIREPLQKHSLFVTQEALTLPDGVAVTTRVIHATGQWIEFEPLMIPMGKKDAHSTGSAITYAKRYQLCAALGVVTDDDDGAAAQKNAPKKEVIPPRMCTEEEYNNFIEKWSNTFDKEKIIEYIAKRSKHFNVDPKITVSILMKDNNKFEIEFPKWESKN
jgi:hypothetical protein